MQVILFENVEKLGMQGDVVSVADGHFRNYLGPRNIAVEASEYNLRRLEAKRKKLQLEAERQRGEAEQLAEQINQIALEYERRASENDRLYGSVQDHEILADINEKGFNLERRQILLPEPIKTLGEHTIRIRLIGDVTAEIKVTVNAEGAEEEEEVVEAAAEEAVATDEAATEDVAEETPAEEATEEPQA